MFSFKLLFSDRSFIKMVLKIILPATLQTLIISLMNMISIFLMGKFVGENAVAGVAITNQIFGLSLLFSYCSSITGNIYAGQYYGKKEWDKIKETTNLKLLLSLTCTIILIVIFFAVSLKGTLSIFIDSSKPNMDEILINGTSYFQYIIWTCLVTAISIPLIQTVNSLDRSLRTLLISGSALVINVVLTFLTLTVMPLPWAHHEVEGPAFAILVARVFELVLLILLYIWQKPFYSPNLKIWKVNRHLLVRSIKTFLFLLPSEVFFQVYFIILTIVITHTSDADTLAMNAISNNLIDISWCVINGFIFSIPQVIGKLLGENKLEEARIAGKKLRTLTMVATTLISILIIGLAFLFSDVLYSHFNQNSRDILFLSTLGNAITYFLYANSYQGFNIVRSGNYQFLPSLCDMPINYVIQLPIAIVLFQFTSLFSGWILFVICFTYLIQFILSDVLFNKLKWNRNIVHKEVI